VTKLDDFVSSGHPLRLIQVLVNEAFGRLNGLLNLAHQYLTLLGVVEPQPKFFGELLAKPASKRNGSIGDRRWPNGKHNRVLEELKLHVVLRCDEFEICARLDTLRPHELGEAGRLWRCDKATDIGRTNDSGANRPT
jgi:hypothetical protein